MWYLLLSIFCSVSVGVVFKISRRYRTNNLQIVGFNYLFALLFCALIFRPEITSITKSAPFLVYGGLGILLPVVFLFLIASIANIGIVKTDAAQRLSLFIPIIMAWLLFNEVFSVIKIVGIFIGFIALFFMLSKPSHTSNSSWKYPVLVFLGFGFIDVLFKKVALYTVVPYTTSLFVVFVIALLVITIPIIYEIIVKKNNLTPRNLFFGFLVGSLNFGNILFYLNAHNAFAQSPSTVFAGMNMGVIILGSLVGVFAFKEKLSTLNYVGIGLALVSILIVVIAAL